MSLRRIILTVALVLSAFATGMLPQANASAVPGGAPLAAAPAAQPQPNDPDYKVVSESQGQKGPSPSHLTHPCAGLAPEPYFEGISPLSIATAGNPPPSDLCSSGYGDIGVWDTGTNKYVVMSGFARRMFHIWNVDNPYSPQHLWSQAFPVGGTASTSAFPFKQGTNRYIGVTMRGSGTGCGFFIYNVTDPANPTFVSRTTGSDWCTPHEHYVSTDANGDADYAWLAMSGETGSGRRVVVLSLSDLLNPVETGRWQRSDAGSGNFIHDVTVIGQRVFLAHWGGGLIIFDKATLANCALGVCTPLNPLDSIRPSGFNVHHAWPTTDGNHVFIEDEFNVSTEKIKLYNIANINNPFFEWGTVGLDTRAQGAQAHNLKIEPIEPGRDRLYIGWYRAGTRAWEVDTTTSPPTIVQTVRHDTRATSGPGFGGTWGVDFLPCDVEANGVMHPTTCIYSADYQGLGLFVDALGYDPQLDPYRPESQITNPTNGQVINTCTYTIQGNAHDYYSGVTVVEVSTDGGSTWQPAQGTTSWSYQWTIPADGAYTIQARAMDQAGNVQNPVASVTVTVVGGCGGGGTPTSTVPVPTATVPVATATSTAMASATSTVAVPSPSATAATPQPTTTACAVRFADVPPQNTFYPFVRCLACQGIVGGYPCGGTGEPCNATNDPYFRPNTNVTRGQISKMVAEAGGFSEPPGNQIFEDVPSGSTFFVWIQRLANRGVMGGYPCGGPNETCGPGNRPYFRPNTNATRGQLAKIVSEAAGFSEPVPGNQQTFTDVAPGSTFHLFIERLVSRQIMGGYPCGGLGEPCDPQNRPYFRPNASVTRGQTAKIVSGAFFPNCSVLRP